MMPIVIATRDTTDINIVVYLSLKRLTIQLNVHGYLSIYRQRIGPLVPAELIRPQATSKIIIFYSGAKINDAYTVPGKFIFKFHSVRRSVRHLRGSIYIFSQVSSITFNVGCVPLAYIYFLTYYLFDVTIEGSK